MVEALGSSATTVVDILSPPDSRPTASQLHTSEDAQPPPNFPTSCSVATPDYNQYPPNTNAASNTIGVHGPVVPPPPVAHVLDPPLSPSPENDVWPINHYITSDPRFRDSTLVFPRFHPHSSWPFWNRHRIAILTALASSVTVAFLLTAIIGSIMIKE